jgi:hypothetical protein
MYALQVKQMLDGRLRRGGKRKNTKYGIIERALRTPGVHAGLKKRKHC